MQRPGPRCATATTFLNRFERDGPNSIVKTRSTRGSLLTNGRKQGLVPRQIANSTPS
jgi:hypothetical protein